MRGRVFQPALDLRVGSYEFQHVEGLFAATVTRRVKHGLEHLWRTFLIQALKIDQAHPREADLTIVAALKDCIRRYSPGIFDGVNPRGVLLKRIFEVPRQRFPRAHRQQNLRVFPAQRLPETVKALVKRGTRAYFNAAIRRNAAALDLVAQKKADREWIAQRLRHPATFLAEIALHEPLIVRDPEQRAIPRASRYRNAFENAVGRRGLRIHRRAQKKVDILLLKIGSQQQRRIGPVRRIHNPRARGRRQQFLASQFVIQRHIAQIAADRTLGIFQDPSHGKLVLNFTVGGIVAPEVLPSGKAFNVEVEPGDERSDLSVIFEAGYA